jgi:hypothetical protein
MGGQIIRPQTFNPCLPPCPPPQPDPCGCGCGDNDLMQCWGQVEAFRCMVTQIVNDILGQSGGPVKTGPIAGVVDGSDAKPGQVGEFYSNNIDGLAIPVGSNTMTISAGVLSPGDWDCYAWCAAQEPLSYMWFGLEPLPTGVSNKMGAIASNPGGNPVEITASSSMARASLTVPTLFPFQLVTENTGTAAATAGFRFAARRRR